jgi:RNA polymerase sigma factor (sigma-70 family)
MRPHEHLTDAELVRLLLTREDEALREELWVEFWRYRFEPVIARTIRRRILRRCGRVEQTLVEDLLQEAFIKLYKDHHRVLRGFEFRNENALPGFLKVMADNIVRDYFRKQKMIIVPLEILPPGPPDFPNDLERQEKVRKIESCLQQLAGKPNFPRDYTAFWLYHRYGFTALAISQRPDIDLANVKGVESLLLRLNRWVQQCVRGNNKKS